MTAGQAEPICDAGKHAAGKHAPGSALERVAAAQADFAAATAALEEASRVRATTCYQAVQAGVKQAAVARVLGVSRPTVLEIVRSGATRGHPVRPTVRAAVAPAVGTLLKSTGPVCLRSGCDTLAEPGARFCGPHRWS